MHHHHDSFRDELAIELDRLSRFTLHLIVDAVITPSLRVFLQQTTTDPQVRRILLTRDAGQPCSHAIMMGRAGLLASTNPQIEDSEKEVVYAATLIARVGAMIETGARQQRLAGACAHGLHRRWRYLLEAALKCLTRSDAEHGLTMRLALGLGRNMDVDVIMDPGQAHGQDQDQAITRCARLQTAVQLAWIQAVARGDKRQLPPPRRSPLALE